MLKTQTKTSKSCSLSLDWYDVKKIDNWIDARFKIATNKMINMEITFITVDAKTSFFFFLYSSKHRFHGNVITTACPGLTLK